MVDDGHLSHFRHQPRADDAHGNNGADQMPPEDDLAAEGVVPGSATGASREGTIAGTGHEADASGTMGAGIDLDWLPEPGPAPRH